MRNPWRFWMFLILAAFLASSCAPAAAPAKPSSNSPAPPSSQAPFSGGNSPGVSTGAGGDQKAAVDRMIVYDSKVSMEVQDATETMDAITDIARRNGGYVVSNSFRLEGERRVGTVTIRVPSRAYDNTIADLRRLAVRVENEDNKSQDVTEEYSDLGAQLRNLEATETQYLQLLKQGQSIDDILKVQARVSETRREIERIKGRMVYLERTTDMASVTVNFFTSNLQKADPKAGLPTWWRKTTDAFDASLVFLGNVATLLGMAVAFLWWLIIPGAVAAFVFGRIGARGKPK